MSGAPVMRSRPAPACRACGGPGATLHEGLTDRLFGAGGAWRMARCGDPACGLLWLDPSPLPEDLGLAYATYYTHGAGEPPRRGAREALRRWAMQGHWAGRYGYRVPLAGPKRLLAALAVRTPELREHLDRLVLMQPPRPGGRALDVGCGDGRTVEALAMLGWDAEGVDFDAAAVRRAAARGLRVRAGSLEDARYPDASFDAVGMSHVIEHLPDPPATLREVRRVLRPGGQLVLATPNAASLGHRRFGRNWRGLEPPRHLQVYTAAALRRAAEAAGLAVVSLESRALGAAFASAESRRIAGEAAARLGDAASHAFAREEAAALASGDAWAGEELLLVAAAP